VPESATVSGEFEALLVTVTPPVALPVAAGVNVAANVAVCPGGKMSPLDRPLALKPAPETLTFEIAMLEFPALVNVTFWLLLVETVTLPKFNAVELALRTRVPALTVRVTTALEELPALLLTITSNCAPLSEVVSAGVVYVAEVAPLIAVPFFFH
jgi:hypothetical protein